MKRNIIIYLAILAAGILAGWLLFGTGKETADNAVEDHSHDKATQVYTCSMHPQIQNPGPGKCPLCGMDLIPLDKDHSNDNPAIFTMTETAAALSNVQTSEVAFADLRKSILLQGKVEVDETRRSSQSVHFSGRIEDLYVTFEGEQVRKGEKLASIYSPELVSAQKELLEALRSQSSNPRLVESARNKLRLWKISENQIKKIEETGSIFEKLDIYTDVAGYVASRKVAVGDYVKAGQILFEIINLDRVWVDFEAYESDIGFIHLSDIIHFTVNAFPEKEFTATVDYIDPLIDRQKRTVSIRTAVKNPGHILKPEMFVTGTLEASLKTGRVMVVPASAVMWTGERSIVYVLLPGYEQPTFELREVKLGENLNSHYVIRRGLQEGDRVVTNGTFTVDAAAQLNNKYSMMNMPAEDNGFDFTGRTPAQFSEQLDKLLHAYLDLKQAMVNTDSQLTEENAGKFMQILHKTEGATLSGNMKDFWEEHLAIIELEGKKIAGTHDMETQRAAFKPFSASIIEVYRSFGVTTPVFVQYCPMADEDRGGYWISDKKKIENPYFGDLMMECGEVKEQLY